MKISLDELYIGIPTSLNCLIFISHEKPDFFSIIALLDKRDVTSGSLNFYSGGKMYFNDLGACI